MKKTYIAYIHAGLAALFIATPTLLRPGCDSVFAGGCDAFHAGKFEIILSAVSYLLGSACGIWGALLYRAAHDTQDLAEAAPDADEHESIRIDAK